MQPRSQSLAFRCGRGYGRLVHLERQHSGGELCHGVGASRKGREHLLHMARQLLAPVGQLCQKRIHLFLAGDLHARRDKSGLILTCKEIGKKLCLLSFFARQCRWQSAQPTTQLCINKNRGQIVGEPKEVPASPATERHGVPPALFERVPSGFCPCWRPFFCSVRCCVCSCA